MDTFTTIKERKAIKKFKDYSLPQVIIENILSLATKAPSSQNRQPWKFSVIQDEKITELIKIAENSKIKSKIDFSSLENAAAVILIYNRFLDENAEKNRDLELLDTISIGTAIQNILLSSETFGLGSVWISDFYFINKEISSWLNENGTLMSGIVIGFPDDDPESKPKVSYKELTAWYK